MNLGVTPSTVGGRLEQATRDRADARAKESPIWELVGTPGQRSTFQEEQRYSDRGGKPRRSKKAAVEIKTDTHR